MAETAQQLPRGRHGLTRDEVLASQRGRMLTAMADAVAEKGFARTTVADVIARAGVSRETFYEQFADKDSCFLAAFDAVGDLLASAMAGAITGEGAPTEPLDRLDGALMVYLDALSREPGPARTFLIDVYGAGPASLARRVEMLNRFVDFVAALLGAETAEERFDCEALVAALSSLVTMRIASGEHESLPALREPVMAIARRVLA